MKKLLACLAALAASCFVFGACSNTTDFGMSNGTASGDSNNSAWGGSDSGSSGWTEGDSGTAGSGSGDSAGAGSGSGDYAPDASGSPTTPPGDVAGDSGTSGSMSVGSGPSGGSASAGGQQKPIVKQLTAAEWRDAYYYDLWLNEFEKDVPVKGQNGTVTKKNGVFRIYKQATRGLETFEMHEVYVSCNDSPAVGAQVFLYNESNKVYSAVTDSTGTAYVFGTGTHITAVSGGFSADSQISEGVTEIALDGCSAYDDELEIMFVVDTTGSMGDELKFLCNELAGIVTRVSSSISCNIRLGLLFYRDIGDEYVTRSFDFVSVNSADGLNKVVETINAQSAAGGGDFPEAVDTALAEAVAADWHTNSKTKLLFHILDAPYHDTQKSQSVFANAVTDAAEKGIRIIPVAASGFEILGQYIMRSAALLTGGTYTFLTNDSGIGSNHDIPSVSGFTVEYLNDLLVRLIKGYYYGQFEDPVPWKESESVI